MKQKKGLQNLKLVIGLPEQINNDQNLTYIKKSITQYESNVNQMKNDSFHRDTRINKTFTKPKKENSPRFIQKEHSSGSPSNNRDFQRDDDFKYEDFLRVISLYRKTNSLGASKYRVPPRFNLKTELANQNLSITPRRKVKEGVIYFDTQINCKENSLNRERELVTKTEPQVNLETEQSQNLFQYDRKGDGKRYFLNGEDDKLIKNLNRSYNRIDKNPKFRMIQFNQQMRQSKQNNRKLKIESIETIKNIPKKSKDDSVSTKNKKNILNLQFPAENIAINTSIKNTFQVEGEGNSLSNYNYNKQNSDSDIREFQDKLKCLLSNKQQSQNQKGIILPSDQDTFRQNQKQPEEITSKTVNVFNSVQLPNVQKAGYSLNKSSITQNQFDQRLDGIIGKKLEQSQINSELNNTQFNEQQGAQLPLTPKYLIKKFPLMNIKKTQMKNSLLANLNNESIDNRILDLINSESIQFSFSNIKYMNPINNRYGAISPFSMSNKDHFERVQGINFQTKKRILKLEDFDQSKIMVQGNSSEIKNQINKQIMRTQDSRQDKIKLSYQQVSEINKLYLSNPSQHNQELQLMEKQYDAQKMSNQDLQRIRCISESDTDKYKRGAKTKSNRYSSYFHFNNLEPWEGQINNTFYHDNLYDKMNFNMIGSRQQDQLR